MKYNIYDNLKSKDVYQMALQSLSKLSLNPQASKFEGRDFLNIITFAAAFRISIHQASQDLKNSPSVSTIGVQSRKVVKK